MVILNWLSIANDILVSTGWCAFVGNDPKQREYSDDRARRAGLACDLRLPVGNHNRHEFGSR
jgi:hypothetical protein